MTLRLATGLMPKPIREAISALLYVGLEFAERQRTGLKEDIEDLQRELRT